MTPPRIDHPAVVRLLRDTLGLDATTILPLRPGAWSTAFAFETPDGPFVLRISDHPDDFDRDAFASRFRSDALPVPRVTHRGRVGAHHYAISERASGEFLDALDAQGFASVTPLLLETLRALRTADLTGTTGYGGWDSHGNGTHHGWRDYLVASIQDNPDQRGGGWRHRLDASPTGAAAFDRDAALFLQRIPDVPEFRHIIHGDMLNFNVFVDADRISGVIDWGCAMYGDYLYELAWFAFWWPWYPQWRDVDIVGKARADLARERADLVSFHERLLVYQVQIGLTHQAYHANTGDWAMLEAVTRRTTAIADEIR